MYGKQKRGGSATSFFCFLMFCTAGLSFPCSFYRNGGLHRIGNGIISGAFHQLDQALIAQPRQFRVDRKTAKERELQRGGALCRLAFSANLV